MPKRKPDSFDSFQSFEEFFKQAERTTEYWVELAKLEFTGDVLSRMKELDVSKSGLATRLDVQPGMVTRLLSGRNNFELATMVRIARALECDFRSHLQRCGTKTCWIDVLDNDPQTENAVGWNPGDFGRIKKLQPTELENEPITAAA